MTNLESIFLGILQGSTEFLPISSSGHLFLAQEFLELKPDLNLEIWLHGASLLAILLAFRHEIWTMIHDFFTDPKSENAKLGYKLILATACTIPIVILIEPYFEDFLTTKTVAITLIITGVLILLAEQFRRVKNLLPLRSPSSLSSFWGSEDSSSYGRQAFFWWVAILLGLIQGLAVIPGISRSGITIAFLILMGLQRESAARISFLLAIPTILGALVFSIADTGTTYLVGNDQLFYAFAAAFASSFLAIKWMMALVQGKWVMFSAYCFVVGAGLLMWLGGVFS